MFEFAHLLLFEKKRQLERFRDGIGFYALINYPGNRS